MRSSSRGRPTIIDKKTLTIPGTELQIVAQYVGDGTTIQIDLPGTWNIDEKLSGTISVMIGLWPHGANTETPLPDHEDSTSLDIDLIDGPLSVAVVGTDYCNIVYPVDSHWFLDSFERSEFGKSGHTRLVLKTDREFSEDELLEISRRVKSRRSRPTSEA